MDQHWCIAEVDIFQDLAPHEMEVIAARAPMQTVDAGAVFYTPEQSGEVLFILKRGRVRLFRLTANSKAFTTAIIVPGTIFGEMAIMGQHMQDQYAEALEACTICLMSKEDVLNLLFTDARIAARIAEILSQRLLDMELRLSGLALKSLPQRVAETLLRFEQATRRPARLFRPTRHEVAVTHEQLAEFVGTYRETMTKTLHELREQGLIELRRGKIVLLDLEGLKSLAAG